jgi:hypothetical protein
VLSFGIVQDGKAIQICCDHEGMAILLRKLAFLVGNSGHVHLYGGPDLSETSPFGDLAVGEVIIDYSPDYPVSGSN